MSIKVSIIIPAYNRVDLLNYTLQSVERAIKDLSAEIVLIDDGSVPPLEGQLKHFAHLPIRFIYQENSGLVLAKNTGLTKATGEYVLFLDSDDLIHPEKLTSQVEAMERSDASVSYSDTSRTTLEGSFESLSFTKEQVLPSVNDPAEFFLKLQPLPHNPLFRREYLLAGLTSPIIPAEARFNPIGEVWMYYNLSVIPARIVHVPKQYTVVTTHKYDRLTRTWERLGIASLTLGILFEKNCPRNAHTLRARQLAGENAFLAYRRLPHHFHPTFERKLIEVWKSAPRGELSKLGGGGFQLLARCIGPERAATLLRRYQRPHYQKIRTIEKGELEQLVNSLP